MHGRSPMWIVRIETLISLVLTLENEVEMLGMFLLVGDAACRRQMVVGNGTGRPHCSVCGLLHFNMTLGEANMMCVILCILMLYASSRISNAALSAHNSWSSQTVFS